jgi:hypothetical protein
MSGMEYQPRMYIGLIKKITLSSNPSPRPLGKCIAAETRGHRYESATGKRTHQCEQMHWLQRVNIDSTCMVELTLMTRKRLYNR